MRHGKFIHSLILIVLVASCLLAWSSVQAQLLPPSPVPVTGEQARAAALAAHPGSALEADLDRVNGLLVWEVKILP